MSLVHTAVTAATNDRDIVTGNGDVLDPKGDLSRSSLGNGAERELRDFEVNSGVLAQEGPELLTGQQLELVRPISARVQDAKLSFAVRPEIEIAPDQPLDRLRLDQGTRLEFTEDGRLVIASPCEQMVSCRGTFPDGHQFGFSDFPVQLKGTELAVPQDPDGRARFQEMILSLTKSVEPDRSSPQRETLQAA